jgi:ribosomal 50S subunit-recycling heat shock protein
MPMRIIDRWLWAARLFNTRTLAAEVLKGGRVPFACGEIGMCVAGGHRPTIA